MMHRIDRQRARTLKNGTGGLVALVACSLLAGCGNVTAGGFGDVTVTVSGDAPDAQGAAPQRAALLRPTGLLATQHDEPEGEVRAEFFINLIAANGSSVSLSEDQIQVRVDVQGRQDLDAVDRQTVPATLYTQIQIVFTDIRVEVGSGLIINGVAVVGEVKVELEDAALVVTRPLNLDIADGESVALLIDLNANTWLQAVDPVLKVIMEEVFANAISVEVR